MFIPADRIGEYFDNIVDTVEINKNLKPYCLNGLKILTLYTTKEICFDDDEITAFVGNTKGMEDVDIKLLISMCWYFDNGYWVYENVSSSD